MTKPVLVDRRRRSRTEVCVVVSDGQLKRAPAPIQRCSRPGKTFSDPGKPDREVLEELREHGARRSRASLGNGSTPLPCRQTPWGPSSSHVTRSELRHNRPERSDQFEARDVVGIRLDIDQKLGEPAGIFALV
jgi:hypothetical protein